MTKSTRDIGKQLEDFVTGRLRSEKIDIRSRRTPGSGQGNKLKADVANDLDLAIECKNTQRLPSSAWRQTQKQVTNGQHPVLVWHPPGEQMENSMVMIPWYYFEELLRRSLAPKTENPDREFKGKIDRLQNTAKGLLKYVRRFDPKMANEGTVRELQYIIGQVIGRAKAVFKELD